MRKAILIILCFFIIIFIKHNIVYALETDFLFSEIMYDYPGSDNNHEWVEVYNSGQDNVNIITGSSGNAWRFFDGSNHVLNLYQGTTTILSEEYFIIADNAEQFILDYPNTTSTIFDTSMNLLNSSSTLSLSFDGGDTYPILMEYNSDLGANGNGKTLEKINLNQEDIGNWQESIIQGGTPGMINGEQNENSDGSTIDTQLICPSTLFINEEGVFDASNSIDSQGLPLDFLWDFMDGYTATTSITTHLFVEQGNYNVSINISNGEEGVVDYCLVEVIENNNEETNEEDNNSNGGSNNQQNNNWSNLIISEFLPNPEGSDDNEWIELHNNGYQTIDLTGFKLQDNSSRIFTFSEDDNLDLTLSSQEYFVLGKDTTGISLNNTGGDSVKLYNPEEELQQQVEYTDKALENKSYAMYESSFKWTSVLTPGEENVFLENQKPEAKISLESSEFIVGEVIVLSADKSFDPEEGKLKYVWDFGDETTGDEKTENHIYQSSGKYLIRLTVTDEEDSNNEDTLVLEITKKEEDIELKDIKPIDFNLDDLIISEFLPNPEGSDDNEWIELHNNSSKDIDLLGWQLDDEDGGSKKFIFQESYILKPNSFAIIPRSESKITLNNNKDEVRLLTPIGDIWQSVEYQKIKEGNSYAWDNINKEWFNNNNPLPGEYDYFIQEPEIIYNINEVKEFDKNDHIIVQGVVLYDYSTSSRKLYLVDYNGVSVDYNEIIEIYSHKKEFPSVKSGDFIKVNGSISKTNPLIRLKTKSIDDFSIINNEIKFDKIQTIDLIDIDDEYIGDHVSIKGIVVKKTKKNIYLAENKDEDYILRVSIDNYDDLEIKKESEIIASGILLDTSNGYKLVVNNSGDILIPHIVKAANIKQDNNENTTTSIKTNTKQDNNVKLILFIFIITLFFILFFKKIKTSRETKNK